jgi:hypothetical protein
VLDLFSENIDGVLFWLFFFFCSEIAKPPSSVSQPHHQSSPTVSSISTSTSVAPPGRVVIGPTMPSRPLPTPDSDSDDNDKAQKHQIDYYDSAARTEAKGSGGGGIVDDGLGPAPFKGTEDELRELEREDVSRTFLEKEKLTIQRDSVSNVLLLLKLIPGEFLKKKNEFLTLKMMSGCIQAPCARGVDDVITRPSHPRWTGSEE